jgi:hypothetical protein
MAADALSEKPPLALIDCKPSLTSSFSSAPSHEYFTPSPPISTVYSTPTLFSTGGQLHEVLYYYNNTFE